MTWSNGIDTAQVLAKARKGANRGLSLGAEHVLSDSDAHTPIEEGTLGRSGKVSTDEANLKAAVSYDTPYAVAQHERLDLEHDPGRTAKYLENAFNGGRGTVAQIIAAQVRSELQS